MGDLVLRAGDTARMNTAAILRPHDGARLGGGPLVVRPAWRSALGSAAAHGTILAALSLAVLRPLGAPSDALPVALVFATPAPIATPAAAPAAPAPVAAASPPAAPSPTVGQVAPPMPMSVPAPRPLTLAMRHSLKPARPMRAPLAAMVPAVMPTPMIAAPAAPAASHAVSPAVSPDLIAGLEARIQRAVQEAALYPPVAKRMHREGRAQVRFDYRDGTVQAVALAQSSRSALLDQAALAAVAHAAYPAPPAPIARKNLALLVWVNFGMVSQE